MGYAIIPYRMNWPRFTRVYGSRDRGLVRTTITMQHVYEAETCYDDEDLDESEEPPTIRQAIAAIVDGGPFDADFPGVYVVALKALCAQLGEQLDDLLLASPDVPLVGVTEQELKDLGVSGRLSIFRLVYRGAPWSLPATEDRPTVGYLTPGEVAAAGECYPAIERRLSPAAHSVILPVSEWLRAANNAREGLVCFYT
jgi:hypothetical protein